MGMSTYIVGIKPPDAKWLKMKAVYDACVAANIDRPFEVNDYFNDEAPDPSGVIAYLTGIESDDPGGAVAEYNEIGRSGYEVDLTKLPKDIKILRFYNSW